MFIIRCDYTRTVFYTRALTQPFSFQETLSRKTVYCHVSFPILYLPTPHSLLSCRSVTTSITTSDKAISFWKYVITLKKQNTKQQELPDTCHRYYSSHGKSLFLEWAKSAICVFICLDTVAEMVCVYTCVFIHLKVPNGLKHILIKEYARGKRGANEDIFLWKVGQARYDEILEKHYC